MDYLIRYRLIVGERMMYRKGGVQWVNQDIRSVLPSDVREELRNKTTVLGPRKLSRCGCGKDAVFFQSKHGIKVGCQGSCRSHYCCPNCSDAEVYEKDPDDLGLRNWNVEYVGCINKECPLCGYRFYSAFGLLQQIVIEEISGNFKHRSPYTD
jgi:hypothetical protein